MSDICCVDGCPPAKEDVTFFKFPNSRSLRKKWLDAIPSTVRVTLDTAVCSRHFLAEQYEVVRSKRRLKAKVVPSVFDTITEPTPKTDDLIPEVQKDRRNNDRVSAVTIDNKADEELASRTDPPHHRLEDDAQVNESSMKNGPNEDIIKRTQTDNVSITDSEISNKDIEDIITNYQIKQTRPLHQETEADVNGDIEKNKEISRSQAAVELNSAEIEIEITGEANEVIDVDNVADPVFIEVSVGKDGGVQEPNNQDCLMLLESVQCEVDPSSLVFPDPEPDPAGTDSDVVDLGERKEDPISLLTSSDEDEVIIQEPEYDMVEVSDATDEDDVPLVKLVAKPKTKIKIKQTNKKSKKASQEILTKILWGQLYEYYCMECQFKTTSRAEFKIHKRDHSTVIQVCQLCSYTTSSQQQFIRHKRKHVEEKKYKCHLCKYKAKHNMSLIYHMKSHEEVQIVEDYKCEKCTFQTSVKSDLLKHARTCRSDCKRFSCNLCTYQTNRRSDMRRHKDRKHQNGDDEDDVDYVPG